MLDIGCGPGLAFEAAARAATTGRVTGIDQSPVMVAMAARRLRRLSTENPSNRPSHTAAGAPRYGQFEV